MSFKSLQDVTQPRHVTILGSTGSIGSSTLDLIQHRPEAFVVEALVAHRNVELLVEQVRAVRPHLAVMADEECLPHLRDALAGTDVVIAGGISGVREAAMMPADWVMAGIVGFAGLEPSLLALRRGAIVALANKECLVCAGSLMLKEVQRYGATLLPVDSEHNALFQLFDSKQKSMIQRLILTASGGPFHSATLSTMASATPEQTIMHPTWSMGAKISVDSATMMNKGLEIIEAHHLFDMGSEQISVLIHPQSIIHSMIEYIDGSTLAQLGIPDMRIPIAYTLSWPERMTTPVPRLDLATIGQLTFKEPDVKRFPAITLARQALESGGTTPTILNAANEVAVQAFLQHRIGFLDIVAIVTDILATMDHTEPHDLDDIVNADQQARRLTLERLPS